MTLFDAPAPPGQPAAGPGAGPGEGPEEAPAMVWRLDPERHYPDGRKRPRFTMPEGWVGRTRRRHWKTGKAALERQAEKKAAQKRQNEEL